MTAVESARAGRIRPENTDAQDLSLHCLANFNGNITTYRELSMRWRGTACDFDQGDVADDRPPLARRKRPSSACIGAMFGKVIELSSHYDCEARRVAGATKLATISPNGPAFRTAGRSTPVVLLSGSSGNTNSAKR